MSEYLKKSQKKSIEIENRAEDFEIKPKNNNKKMSKELKESLHLKTLREMMMTPKSKLNSFWRMVIMENKRQQGKYSYIASQMTFDQIELDHFIKEAEYMKGFEVQYDKHVKLNREIRKLSDMTDEQILCYYTLVPEFKNLVIGRVNVYYAKYYALEVANLIYDSTPVDAYLTLFEFWDALVKAKKRTYNDEYFLGLCDAFMIAHPELMPIMLDDMRDRGCFLFDSRIYEEIFHGDYGQVATFVQEKARLLKVEEIFGEEEYITATWNAMPYVFESLSATYSTNSSSFERIILKGYVQRNPIKSIIMKDLYTNNYTRREISKYEYFEWNEYRNGWDKIDYKVDESVQDFLYIIHLYTESFMRELFLVKGKRIRSAGRFLNKQYRNVRVDRNNLIRMKEILKSDTFERTIEQGVLNYINQEQIQLPSKPKKKSYQQEIYQMDHLTLQSMNAQIDLDKLSMARRDADSIIGLLHHEEIAYETEFEVKEESCMDSVTDDTLIENNGSTQFTELEHLYLNALCEGELSKACELSRQAHIPENVMVRNINEKAIDIFSDVLLEKVDGEVTIVEDYMNELTKILR